MKFTVTWKPEARRELAEIWLRADDRAAVSRAANSVDCSLRMSPTNCGESRSENIRLTVHPPLAVLFEVHGMDMRVDVLSVRARGAPS